MAKKAVTKMTKVTKKNKEVVKSEPKKAENKSTTNVGFEEKLWSAAVEPRYHIFI